MRQQNPPPDKTEPFTIIDNDSLHGGTYSAKIIPLATNSTHYIKHYDIRKRGNGDRLSKIIQVRVKSKTFADYAYVSGSENENFRFARATLLKVPFTATIKFPVLVLPIFLGLFREEILSLLIMPPMPMMSALTRLFWLLEILCTEKTAMSGKHAIN